MIFEDIDENEVLCNELAMYIAQTFCDRYSELEGQFYERVMGNHNAPHSGRVLPRIQTVFKAPAEDMYPQLYLFVLENISPFLLKGEGNTKTKIASLKTLLERKIFLHIDEVAYQCSGIDDQGNEVTPELANQTAQTCIDMIKETTEGRKRNTDVGEAIMNAKTLLMDTRESWVLDVSSLLLVVSNEINKSLSFAQQAIDVLSKAQKLDETTHTSLEQSTHVEISSNPLSAENLKRREKVEVANEMGLQGKQSAP